MYKRLVSLKCSDREGVQEEGELVSDSGVVAPARANLPQRRAGAGSRMSLLPHSPSPHTQPSGNDTLAARSQSAAAGPVSTRGHVKQLHCPISNSPAQPSTPCRSQISAVSAAWPASWPSTLCGKERSPSLTATARIIVQPRLRCFFWRLFGPRKGRCLSGSAPKPRLWRHAPSGLFVLQCGTAWHGMAWSANLSRR